MNIKADKKILKVLIKPIPPCIGHVTVDSLDTKPSLMSDRGPKGDHHPLYDCLSHFQQYLDMSNQTAKSASARIVLKKPALETYQAYNQLPTVR